MQKTTDSYIRAIGFKNFRRFKELDKLQLGNINLFVGQNNSGKSTLVKAILLVQEFLKEGDISVFSLTNKQLENTNIVTFGRALNSTAADNQEKTMSFHFEVGDYTIDFEVTGDEYDSALRVTSFSIKLAEYIFSGTILLNNAVDLTISFNPKPSLDSDEKNMEIKAKLEKRINEIETKIESDLLAESLFEDTQQQVGLTYDKVVEMVENITEDYNHLYDLTTSYYFKEEKLPEPLEDSFADISQLYSSSIISFLQEKKGQIDKLKKLEVEVLYKKLQPLITKCDILLNNLTNTIDNSYRKVIIDAAQKLKAGFTQLLKELTHLTSAIGALSVFLELETTTTSSHTIKSSHFKDFDEKNRLLKELEKVEKIERATKKSKSAKPTSLVPLKYKVDLELLSRKSLSNILTEVFDKNLSFIRGSVKGRKSGDLVASARNLKDSNKELSTQVAEFENIISSLNFYHIGTNNGSQASILSVRDRNNPLAMAAHDFFQLELKFNTENISRIFVSNWLETFEIGNDFRIDQIAGEAYSIQIKTDGRWGNLSDMGMGAIQVTLLLLRLACIIELTSKRATTISPTVLIEEPEINLHPKLQSKLADLFSTAQEVFKLQLIVETHSEYLIRQSQVIVNNHKQDDDFTNPFSTYYFSKNDGPYEMKYRKDGKFENEFEEGFFNVSTDQTFEIL